MKTIQEQASHRWEQSQGEFSVNDFKEGVDFAQRWIPVSEEMPEVDKDDRWNHAHFFSKQVLTKNYELNFPNYKVQGYIEKLKKWQNSDKVTHWRPIELV